MSHALTLCKLLRNAQTTKVAPYYKCEQRIHKKPRSELCANILIIQFLKIVWITDLLDIQQRNNNTQNPHTLCSVLYFVLWGRSSSYLVKARYWIL